MRISFASFKEMLCFRKKCKRRLFLQDRILTRVEILESQLSTYGKGVSEDKLREEAIRLMEEKERYQVNKPLPG